ncbi:putative reverse transcriptase domain-containing protein [Tanacetum coccineum]
MTSRHHNRFHELALMCPELVPTEKKKIEKYVRGFPERIKGNITSSKPANLHEAINMARELVEQSVQGRAARIGESNKRKWEDNQRNNNNNTHNYNNNHNNNNNRNRNNNHHQQQNRRPETVRAYAAAPAGGKIYAGNLPKCNRCNLHHHGPVLKIARDVKELGHMRRIVELGFRVQNPNVVTGSFDDIIEWIGRPYHRALINCYEKIVVNSSLKGKILEVKARAGKGSRSLTLQGCEKKLDDIRGTKQVDYNEPLSSPRIDDCFESNTRPCFFSKIDPRSDKTSFEESKKKKYQRTAIRNRYGIRVHNQPFGLTNALAIFMDLMNRICKPHLDKFVIVFIDDILIYSKSEEEHEAHLKTILDLLKKEKFKVESVKNWKTPESSTKIRSFLGLTGYYQRFIENFSKIAKPLTLLTQKKKPMSGGGSELLSDYECEINYYPGKGKLVADPEPEKKDSTSGENESEAFKDLKAPAEWLRGLERHFEQRDDGEIYFFDRI